MPGELDVAMPPKNPKAARVHRPDLAAEDTTMDDAAANGPSAHPSAETPGDMQQIMAAFAEDTH